MRARVAVIVGLPFAVLGGTVGLVVVLTRFANTVTGTGAWVLGVAGGGAMGGAIRLILARGRRRTADAAARRPADSARVAAVLLGLASAIWAGMLVTGLLRGDRFLVLFGSLYLIAVMWPAVARWQATIRAPQVTEHAQGVPPFARSSDPRAVMLLGGLIVMIVLLLVVWLVLNPGNPLLPKPV